MARVLNRPRRLPMTLSISRATSGAGRDSIRIQLVDDASRCLLVRAELSVEDFGYAVTGFAERPCVAELFDGPIGKRHEHKREQVVLPYNLPRDEEALPIVQAAMAPFEVDGWRAHLEDAFNGHRYTIDGDRRLVQMFFERWVDPADE